MKPESKISTTTLVHFETPDDPTYMKSTLYLK